LDFTDSISIAMTSSDIQKIAGGVFRDESCD